MVERPVLAGAAGPFLLQVNVSYNWRKPPPTLNGLHGLNH